MTARRITFTYAATLDVEMDDRDYDTDEDMAEAAWAEFGPECGDQSPGYEGYTVADGILKQMEDRREQHKQG